MYWLRIGVSFIIGVTPQLNIFVSIMIGICGPFSSIFIDLFSIPIQSSTFIFIWICCSIIHLMLRALCTRKEFNHFVIWNCL